MFDFGTPHRPTWIEDQLHDFRLWLSRVGPIYRVRLACWIADRLGR